MIAPFRLGQLDALGWFADQIVAVAVASGEVAADAYDRGRDDVLAGGLADPHAGRIEARTKIGEAFRPLTEQLDVQRARLIDTHTEEMA